MVGNENTLTTHKGQIGSLQIAATNLHHGEHFLLRRIIDVARLLEVDNREIPQRGGGHVGAAGVAHEEVHLVDLCDVTKRAGEI